MSGKRKILILGLGNSLLSDDGAGIHVVNRLRERFDGRDELTLLDGGTIGLSLLPLFDGLDGLIAVDAAEIGGAPGTLAVFEATAMDERLRGRKRTAHEVSLADLMDAALLTDIRPSRRALVAIQPQHTEWGDKPTPAVAAAALEAELQVAALIERWQQ